LKVWEWDVVGNPYWKAMVAAEKRLEQLSETTLKDAEI